MPTNDRSETSDAPPDDVVPVMVASPPTEQGHASLVVAPNGSSSTDRINVTDGVARSIRPDAAPHGSPWRVFSIASTAVFLVSLDVTVL